MAYEKTLTKVKALSSIIERKNQQVVELAKENKELDSRLQQMEKDNSHTRLSHASLCRGIRDVLEIDNWPRFDPGTKFSENVINLLKEYVQKLKHDREQAIRSSAIKNRSRAIKKIHRKYEDYKNKNKDQDRT